MLSPLLETFGALAILLSLAVNVRVLCVLCAVFALFDRHRQ
jgi:hypothetical protein